MSAANTPAIIPEGARWHPDMPAAIYHSDPALEPSISAGLIKRLIGQSPLHAWTHSPRLNPFFEPKKAAAFDIGTAAHAMLIGRGDPIQVIEADSYRSKEAKEQRDLAYTQGRTPLLSDQHDRVEAMAGAARLQIDNHAEGDLFEGADHREAAAFALIDGAWCRCLCDLVHSRTRMVWDYKTTAATISPDTLDRYALSQGWDVIAAHYTAVMDAVFPDARQPWRYGFIVQEVEPPHLLMVAVLSSTTLEMGRRKAAQARQTWRECLRANNWPGWPGKTIEIAAPAWAENAWYAREAQEAEHKQATGRDILQEAYQWQRPMAAAGE